MENIPSTEILSNPRSAGHIRIHYPQFYAYIKERYPHINKFYAGIYLYLHNMEHPKCPVCGKFLDFISYSRGFKKYCSHACYSRDPDMARRRKETSAKKHGDPNYTNREKAKETCLERYGYIYPSQNKEIAHKSSKANKKSAETAKQKRIKTCLERYGKEYGEDVGKWKETMLERYGTISYHNKEKAKETCLQRYGVENPMQSPRILAKAEYTNLKRYGTEQSSQNEEVKSKIRKTRRKTEMDKKPEDILGYTKDGRWICPCPHPKCTKCQEKQYTIGSTRWLARHKSGAEMCTILNPVGSSRISTSGLMLRVEKVMDELGIVYIKEKRFPTCKNKYPLPFDYFITPNTLIEVQGRQHAEAVDRFGGKDAFEAQQERDSIKKEWCKQNKYTLIEILPKYSDDKIKELLHEYTRLQ